MFLHDPERKMNLYVMASVRSIGRACEGTIHDKQDEVSRSEPVCEEVADKKRAHIEVFVDDISIHGSPRECEDIRTITEAELLRVSRELKN